MGENRLKATEMNVEASNRGGHDDGYQDLFGRGKVQDFRVPEFLVTEADQDMMIGI